MTQVRKIKAFTLVELLIVIVIIGILMSALLPRLSGAQDIARDTSRQVALSQLQTAIMSYKALHGKRPRSGTDNKCDVKGLSSKLVTEGIMTEIPKDPNLESGYPFSGQNVTGSFAFFIIKKNGMTDSAGVLVAKTETAGKSNYVSKAGSKFPDDFKNLILCTDIVKKDTAIADPSPTTTGYCEYSDSSQLWYLLKF